MLSIGKACITLFREIPNEEELYAIFHPPFDVAVLLLVAWYLHHYAFDTFTVFKFDIVFDKLVFIHY